jgi:hypothetical protein
MSRKPIKNELHKEPHLDELLDDPLVQALMSCDGVERMDITDLMSTMRIRRCPDIFETPAI